MRTAVPAVTAVAVLLALVLRAGAEEEAPPPAPPLAHEAVLEAPVAAVWDVFATAEGWKSLGVAKAEVDLRVGGKIRTHYDANGTLGDAGTIENTILAYEPHRMIAFRATKTPAGFPFPKEVVDRTWSVVTMEARGENRTLLTIRGHGYGDDEASQKMRVFFDQGNAWTLRHLADRFRDGPPSPHRPVEVSTVVAAPPAEVFRALTTSEGVKAFLGVDSRIELRPNGPYELYFGANLPEGQRGTEGCVVLSFLPARMFSMTWNAPPSLPRVREGRTVVVIELETESPGRTRVRLTNHGYAERAAAEPELAEEWAKARDYFARAWPSVLAALKKHFDE